jgi:hypothetical protein
MSSQRRLNDSTNTVANELLLLRKLANLRRSASWQLTVERMRKAAPPEGGRRRSVGYPRLPHAVPVLKREADLVGQGNAQNPARRRKVRPADHRSGLPGMSGAELIETVRTERPPLPVVMATA